MNQSVTVFVFNPRLAKNGSVGQKSSFLHFEKDKALINHLMA
jgi:hypothetical protein